MRSVTHRLLAAVAVLALGGCDRASGDPDTFDHDDDFRQSFIPVPDVGGGTSSPCNLYLQDCPAGDKCMPLDVDGSGTWNDVRCLPVAPNPAAVGMPCTIEGPVASGLDDCERGTMCLDLGGGTNEGTCIPMMTGNVFHPICADPMRYPLIGPSTVLPLCLPQCRPLENEYATDLGCYPSDDVFVCAPVAAPGNVGDVCEFLNVCVDGLACVDATELSDCGGPGCCSPYCDTSRPVCPDGLTCQPWPDDTTLLPGGENLGICLG